MNTTASIDDELAWLALQASGVDGNAGVSRTQFADGLRRLHMPLRSSQPPAQDSGVPDRMPVDEALLVNCSEE